MMLHRSPLTKDTRCIGWQRSSETQLTLKLGDASAIETAGITRRGNVCPRPTWTPRPQTRRCQLLNSSLGLMDIAGNDELPVLARDLVSDLNAVLVALHLPLSLESPDDLIPSLLVAILECLLRSRLDIPPEVRQARDFASKVQAMKIFLGVLENDVLGQDVGLSDVDPRRLARGEWDECIFVGELLCWLGRTMGMLPYTNTHSVEALPAKFARRSGTVSSSTHSTGPSNLSLAHPDPTESDTTVESIAFEPVGESTFIHRPSAPTPTAAQRDAPPCRPWCIHDIEEPSLIFTPVAESSVVNGSDASDVEYCDCPSEMHVRPAKRRVPPVRYDGYIERVDNESEVRSFDRSQSTRSSTSRPRSTSSRSVAPSLVTRHTSPAEYTVALMNERARLFTELVALKTPPKKG